MSERRTASRQKSFLRGTIFFNKRLSSVDCLVRDISPTGARLIFTQAVTTPDHFELHIPQKDETLLADVQWRHGTEIGVAFAGAEMLSAEHPAAGSDLTARVERLEAEIVALKRMLKRLKGELGRPEVDAA